MKLLHPFMPFITEELWQHIYDRKEGESLMVQQLNIPTACNEIIVKEFEVVKEVIGGIRTIRLQKNIAQKETLELQVVGVNPVATFNPVITKLCNLSSIEAVENKADGSGSFMVGTTEYAIPLGNLINTEEELAKLEADLKYQEGFLQSVLKKLSNEIEGRLSRPFIFALIRSIGVLVVRLFLISFYFVVYGFELWSNFFSVCFFPLRTFFLICVKGTLCSIECCVEVLYCCKFMLSDDIG